MPNVFNYPLDLTGVDPNNRITQEAVTIVSTKKYRSVTPQYAPYFYESLVIQDASTLRTLAKDIEYRGADIASMATADSGKDIYRTIIILNPQVPGNVLITYQTVGDKYVQDYTGIQNLVDNLLSDTRPLGWNNVLGKPLEFDPTMHLHSAGEVVGFEYVVSSLESVKNAILMGDQLQSDAILAYIDQRLADLTSLINLNTSDVTYNAMLSAQSAKNTADTATEAVNSRIQDISTLQKTVNDLSALIDMYDQQAALARSSVSSYLTTYPITFNGNGSATLNTPVDTNITQPVRYGSIPVDTIVDTDYYVLDLQGVGRINVNNISADYYENVALKVKLTTRKEQSSGYFRIDLSIAVPDTRDVNLGGVYAKSMAVKVFPFILDNGDGKLDPVSAWYSNFSINNTRIDTTVGDVSYQVYGAATVPITDTNWSIVAENTQKYLLDTRADYNVSNYGSVNSRKAITFNLPIGTEMVMSFRLSAVTAAQVEKAIAMNFSHSGDILNGVVSGVELTESVLYPNPRGGRVLALSTKSV